MVGIGRKFYNLISQGTGFGITANIIDCYAAVIRLWQPGDGIYLFGFSRGAYTVRCLAAVIAYCGIPTKLPNGKPVKLDVASTKKLASYVASVFMQRLRELGWHEGRNLAVEVRWAEGRRERLAEIAAEFVRLKVDVIVTYTLPAIFAAKQATSTISISRATTAS